ncbi:hypothetical protein PENSTE_c012G09765 [Penicillium steckii]|uniref:FAD-binding PCMH-type domain-containing protein n=1 Tax=Penicillium steckii TaxID=303698 RepID=A0A1V6T4L5_9EURO|nr:hypothetical protein PENSTE_c012G09765 [Penicillium steckii]
MQSKISIAQIQELELQLGSNVFKQGSCEFNTSIKRWSSVGNQTPGVVVIPETADHIARTVIFVKKNQIDFAVKGGGHSTDTSSSTDGGILLDLCHLNRVTVCPETKTLTVEGGALWNDVNEAASIHDLAVVGGTVSQTGVGGLTLRGGYGYLTPQYGLAIDNLLKAKIITPDGSILNVSSTENSELFWALRGAGQNFAIVVEFVFQGYSQHNDVWNGTITYHPNQLAEVIQALNSSLFHVDGKAAAQCVFSLSPDNEEPLITTVLFFNGSEKEGRHHFKMLLSITCIEENMQMKPYSEANTLLNALVPPGGPKSLLGVQLATPLKAEFTSSLLETITTKLKNEPDLRGSCLELDFFDPTRICKTSVTDTAFPRRDDSLNGALILQWKDSTNDSEYISWGETIQMMCVEEMERTKNDSPSFVSNFVGYTKDDGKTPEEMFGVNADRLLSIKRKYDPDNLFCNLNPLSLSLTESE